MSKGGDQVQETPQQRAMTEHAVNLMNDYRQRWMPVQQKLAAQVEAEGAPNSAARRAAAGKAATDTQMQFGGAQGEVEKTLTNSGAAVGSSKSNLAVTGMGDELAKSKGVGTTISDQQIDDAYTQGLSALMAIGQGKAATVSNSLAGQAQQSGYQAAADAQQKLSEHAGAGQLLGSVAGFGLKAAMGGGGGGLLDGLQAKFSNTSLGSSGFGSGLAYGNQDLGGFL